VRDTVRTHEDLKHTVDVLGGLFLGFSNVSLGHETREDFS
jgi:hypothetical protein